MTFSEQVGVEPVVTQPGLESMGHTSTNVTQPTDNTDSSLPDLSKICPGTIVGFSKLSHGNLMVALPKSISSGVYMFVVNNSPGENQFTLVEADLEYTSTVDTYTVSVDFDKNNRSTFMEGN